MSFFLLSFLTSWILGVVAGVWSENIVPVIIATAGIPLLLAWKYSVPHMAALLALVALGWIYSAAPAEPLPQQCVQINQPLQLHIAAVRSIEQTRTQYVAKDAAGCSHLVYMERFPLYQEGDVIEITGEATPIDKLPQELSGFATYLARQGISSTIRYPKVLHATRTNTNISDTIYLAARSRIERTFSEPEASIIGAMILADQGTIPQQIEEQFRKTGTSHVLAISGSNISLIAGMVVAASLLLPVSPWTRSIIVLTFLWTYAWLIAAPASAIRALIFWTIALLAFRLQALVRLPTVMIFALAAMITRSPDILLDVGFQLSFAAVVGIGLSLFISKDIQETKKLRPVSTAIIVTMGATLATLPIGIWHFGTLSISGLFANLIVVPAISLLLILGFLALFVGAISHPAALFVSEAAHLIWTGTHAVISTLSEIPGLFLENISMPLWAIYLYYVSAVALASIILKAQSRTWREVWE